MKKDKLSLRDMLLFSTDTTKIIKVPIELAATLLV